VDNYIRKDILRDVSMRGVFGATEIAFDFYNQTSDEISVGMQGGVGCGNLDRALKGLGYQEVEVAIMEEEVQEE
jgi:hypothetical protein